MGREAQVTCRIGSTEEAVKALLESQELVLRGATLRRRWPLADLKGLAVRGEALAFRAGGEAVALQLGAAEAAKWKLRIETPPPGLARKLGIAPDRPAAVFGPVDDDPALAAALQGACTDSVAEATVLVAVVLDDAALAQAMALHRGLPCDGLWVVHAKGRGVALPESRIRETLRAQGYVDHKTSAVSERLTATRYRRR